MPANAEVSMCRPAVLRQSAQIVRDDFQPCSQLIRNGARRHGVAAPPAKLAPGALEGSNVNPVEQMVSMISLARQYDMHMKLLQNAENNAKDAAQLLGL